jgi:hypothetical protein
MKQKIFLFILISGFVLLSNISLPNHVQTDNNSTYLSISFQNTVLLKDNVSQSSIKSKIENVFENEGIHISHIEKPAEYKLYINIIISDSLIIRAKGIAAGGASTIYEKKPQVTYSYKNEEEIYNFIIDYIKKYL